MVSLSDLSGFGGSALHKLNLLLQCEKKKEVLNLVLSVYLKICNFFL